MQNIFEKYGIVDLENDPFNNAIINLDNDITSNIGNDIELFNIPFKKISINLSNVCEWIDILNIFYTSDVSFKTFINGTSIAITDNDNTFDETYYKKLNNHIQIASILICFDTMYNIGVLYHEIAHIYDSSKFVITYYDEIYALKNEYNISHEIMKDFSISTLHNLITYCMYYANISEKHAFIETARFEMIKSLSNFFNLYRYLRLNNIKINATNILLYSSNTINDYHWMICSLKNAKEISNDIKNLYIKQYAEDIKNIYGKPYSFDNLINYFLKKLEHSYSNMKKLFNLYYNIYDIDNRLQIHEKYNFMHSSIMK